MVSKRTVFIGLAVAISAASACGGGSKTPTSPTNLTISAHPQSQTVASGESATLRVTATGTGTLRYQWYVGESGVMSTPIAGATGAAYTTPALTSTTHYWVRLSDATTSADSTTATVTVHSPQPPSQDPPPPPAPPPSAPPSPPAGTAPAITSQPQSQTIGSGQAVTLTVAANGTSPLGYQWYVGSSGLTSSPVAGATGASFTTPALSTTTSYWVRVSNAFGVADSVAATITVTAPPPTGVAPAITLQPQNQTIAAGQAATLVIAASGTEPMGYQWYVGPAGTTSSPVAGATSPAFTTPPLTITTSYWVRVSNAYGASNSIAATITVSANSSNTAFEDQVHVLVNQRRAAGATCGSTAYPPVSPLTMNESLRTAARNHSLDMATQNYFSHTSLDGRTFDQRIRNAGYTGSFPLGENIAGGPSTPQSVVDGWMGSPAHCANIMNGAFRATGVGSAFNPAATYRHYWAQTFGGS